MPYPSTETQLIETTRGDIFEVPLTRSYYTPDYREAGVPQVFGMPEAWEDSPDVIEASTDTNQIYDEAKPITVRSYRDTVTGRLVEVAYHGRVRNTDKDLGPLKFDRPRQPRKAAAPRTPRPVVVKEDAGISKIFQEARAKLKLLAPPQEVQVTTERKAGTRAPNGYFVKLQADGQFHVLDNGTDDVAQAGTREEAVALALAHKAAKVVTK